MNINIVEGEYVSDDLYELIKKDYMHSNLKIKEIKEKYGLGETKWDTIRRDIIEETGYRRRRVYGRKCKSRYEPSFITVVRDQNRFKICKKINGTTVTFGCNYISYDDAEKVVEKLKDCGWDKEQLQKIREGLGV